MRGWRSGCRGRSGRGCISTRGGGASWGMSRGWWGWICTGRGSVRGGRGCGGVWLGGGREATRVGRAASEAARAEGIKGEKAREVGRMVRGRRRGDLPKAVRSKQPQAVPFRAVFEADQHAVLRQA